MKYVLKKFTCAPHLAITVCRELKAKAQGAAEAIMVATMYPLIKIPLRWVRCKVREPLQRSFLGHYRGVEAE